MSQYVGKIWLGHIAAPGQHQHCGKHASLATICQAMSLLFALQNKQATFKPMALALHRPHDRFVEQPGGGAGKSGRTAHRLWAGGSYFSWKEF